MSMPPRGNLVARGRLADMTRRPQRAGTGRLKFLAGLLLSGLALILLFRGVRLSELWGVLEKIRVGWLAVAGLAVACDYGVRILRWRLMLRVRNPDLPYWKCAGPLLGSMALNNLLPLRLGDVARATAFSAPLGVSTSFATGTMVVERCADLLALLLGASIGLLAYQGQGSSIVALTAGVIGGGALLAIGLVIVLGPHLLARLRRLAYFQKPTPGRVMEAIVAFFDAMGELRRPGILFGLGMSTIAAWILEGLVFYAAFQAVGASLMPLGALFVTCTASLATIIPSSPGYIGTFHLAVQQAAQLLGVSLGNATIAAIVVHGALWLLVTGAGVAWLGARGLQSAIGAAKTRRIQGEQV